MEMILLILLGAFLFFLVIPAVLFYIILFGRMPEKTAAGSGLQKTYYAPYAEKMIGAEARMLSDKDRHQVTMTARDGTVLCADLLEHGNDKLVLMVHGYMTAPSKNFALIREKFAREGYDAMLIHQRAHGPSGGKHCTMGLKEQFDVLDWIEWCRELGKYRAVVLYGISMGSTTISFAADRIDNSFVKVMIQDSGYTSVATQLRNLAKRWHIPFFMIIMPLGLFARILLGVNLYDSVHDSLRNTCIPAIFIHGMADGTVSLEQCKANYECCAADKLFISVPKAEHTLAMIAGGSEVWKQVSGFIRHYMN